MRIRLPLVAAAAAAGFVGGVVARRKHRRQAPQIRTGTFSNGIGYEAFGQGPLTVIFLPGGPGIVPMARARVARTLLWPLAGRGCTVWRLTRRPSMPQGHSLADMADDVAEVIDEGFNGHVDAVVGVSMGGLIAMYLAARHPRSMRRVVLISAAATATDAVVKSTSRYGEALGHGRFTEAGEAMLEDPLPGERMRPVRRLLSPLVGRMLASSGNNPPDVLAETRAVTDADARPVLPGITAPTLIIIGDQDTTFTQEAAEQTVQLIPDCTLVRYGNRNHVGTVWDERTPDEVFAFIHRDE
jgi:pimeloyl-ACP methyl ester carboxylesterase